MTIALIIVLVVLVLIVAGGVAYAMQRRRRHELQEQFGGEYDRTVDRTGNVRAAERQLLDRKKHHEKLDIHPLPRQRVTAFAAQWEVAQAEFVDRPEAALVDADELVEEVMSERGYPTGGFDEKVETLSVEHADVLQHYRAAHAIALAARDGQADTEQMRRAMQHYRELFQSLLDDTPRQRVDEPETSGGHQ